MVYGEVADSIQGAPEPLSRRPRFATDAEWTRVRRARDGVRAAPARARRAPRLPSPHGRVRRDAGGRRPADALTGPEVGLLHDTGHVTFAGGDAPTELAQARRARRATCTARTCGRPWQGWRATAAGASSNRCSTARSARPAKACVDFAAVIAILRDAGYRGLARRRGRAGPGGRAGVPLRRHGVPAALDARRRKVRCRSARCGIAGIDSEGGSMTRIFSSRPRAPGARSHASRRNRPAGATSASKRCGSRRAKRTRRQPRARELCIVVIAGRVDGRERRTRLARTSAARASPFEDVAPHAVYLPPGRDVRDHRA